MLANLHFFCLKFYQHFVLFPFLMQNCPIYFTSSLLSCCGLSTLDHFPLKTKTKNSITVFLSALINFLLFLCLFIFTGDSHSYLFQAVSVFILMFLLSSIFGLVWKKRFYPTLKRMMVYRFRYIDILYKNKNLPQSLLV